MLKIGQIVVLNPELFKDTAKFDDMVGDLGYVKFFSHFNFEIIDQDVCDHRGPYSEVIILNPKVLIGLIPGVKDVKYEGTLILLTKDLIAA